MKKLLRGKYIWITLGAFTLLLIGIGVFIYGFGTAYRRGLATLTQPLPEALTLKKKKIVSRITVKKSGESGCIEVTPDGIVRVYENCEGELTSAHRLIDPKNILKLFKLVSERDLEKSKKSGDNVYELILDTESGKEVVYVIIDGGDGEIIQAIENIKGDVPGPVATPAISPAPQTPVATPPAGSSPQIVSSPQPSATPPTGGQTTIPFVCDFSETSDSKKPYRVSNVVCTTEPSPVP